jgi:hypothetical protein
MEFYALRDIFLLSAKIPGGKNVSNNTVLECIRQQI